MAGGLILVIPFLSGGLLAASLRFRSLVSTLLAAYLAFVALTVGGVLALSPGHEVRPLALGLLETGLLVAACVIWWLRGRPGPAWKTAVSAVREAFGRTETALFLAFTAALLAYELVLALTVPPNNWDSLSYHLARAVGWLQNGGYSWIPNAPTIRINEFQPLAEQENLYFFAALGRGALYAFPQYLAQLAILVAVFGSSRRLGFSVRAAVSASCLVATFSLFALESTTAQNDLVAASFPAVAGCLLLEGGDVEAALAGVAVGFGIGTKLTTVLVLPVLVWLAVLRGRRLLLRAVAGGVAGLVVVGMWGYVLNLAHTGSLLGANAAQSENTTSPGWPRSAVTALDVLYQAMDTSVMSDRLIDGLAAAGAVAGVIAAIVAVRRRRSLGGAGVVSAEVAVPLAAPLIVIGVAAVLAVLASWWGHPVRGPDGSVGGVVRQANEDRSAFGPVGSLVLLGVPVLAAVAYTRRRADARLLALGLAIPCFLVLLALESEFNLFLSRFLIVPVALAMPVTALLFRSRTGTAAIALAAAVTATITIVHDGSKPLTQNPWTFTQASAVDQMGEPRAAAGIRAYGRSLPAGACVGAVLGGDEPSYPLYGPRFQHRVEYLTTVDPVLQALQKGLFYVVINNGADHWLGAVFRHSGWKTRSLGGYWLLASEPHATNGTC